MVDQLEIDEIDDPRVQSSDDSYDSEQNDDMPNAVNGDFVSEAQRKYNHKLQYYGKFSLHNDPDAAIGLMALRKGQTNDFTV